MPSAQNFCGLFIVCSNKKNPSHAAEWPGLCWGLSLVFALGLVCLVGLPKIVRPANFLLTVNTEGIIPH